MKQVIFVVFFTHFLIGCSDSVKESNSEIDNEQALEEVSAQGYEAGLDKGHETGYAEGHKEDW